MRILFVGDVIGRTGRNAIAEHLPNVKRGWKLDLAVDDDEIELPATLHSGQVLGDSIAARPADYVADEENPQINRS